jgi:hypothetical protein
VAMVPRAPVLISFSITAYRKNGGTLEKAAQMAETVVHSLVRGGPFWTPITPQTRSFLHAESHAWLEAQAGWYGMGTFVRRMSDGIEFSHTGEVAGQLGGG